MIRTIHRAKYVLAEPDLLLQNAAVHVSAPGRVSRIEPWHAPPAGLEAKVIDWGCALIHPGLVNCHAHLELTGLGDQLRRFSSFTDWLAQLVEKRRAWTPQDYLDSVRAGAKMSLSAGTTLVGDISTGGVSWRALKGERLRKVVFHEILGLQPEKSVEILASLENLLDQVAEDEFLSCGISPHAPYSVSTDLYRGAAEISRRRGFPLSTHVAETEAELEFLRSGTGEFRDFLGRLGVLPAAWVPPKLDPFSYLESLDVLERPAILAHCNYLKTDSMASILRSRSSVVYCPRSHAFFSQARHPVRRLLDMGVNVALGTDSLASNQSLSILDEMRFLFKQRKDLKSEEIFRMATVNGAAALGFGSTLGRLRRGFWADMAILALPEEVGYRSLCPQVLEGAGEHIATIVRGQVVREKDS